MNGHNLNVWWKSEYSTHAHWCCLEDGCERGEFFDSKRKHDEPDLTLSENKLLIYSFLNILTK